MFLYSTAFIPAPEPNQPPIQWLLRATHPGVQRPGREADYFTYIIMPRSIMMDRIPLSSIRLRGMIQYAQKLTGETRTNRQYCDALRLSFPYGGEILQRKISKVSSHKTHDEFKASNSKIPLWIALFGMQAAIQAQPQLQTAIHRQCLKFQTSHQYTIQDKELSCDASTTLQPAAEQSHYFLACQAQRSTNTPALLLYQ